MDKKLFIETYGCQMNVSDSEVIAAILSGCGYSVCDNICEAELIIINTCAIREGAEKRIWGRLDQFAAMKKKNRVLKVAIVGCMAERIKDKLLEHPGVDIVAGPDSYRRLPLMLSSQDKAVDVTLDRSETYCGILPSRAISPSKVSCFISIMRGCNNVCSYCIVPYTRGVERSRPVESILAEARQAISDGYREITLLGQNVDSYLYEGVDFADLIAMVADLDQAIRIRFSTSHPKDISDKLIYTMASRANIAHQIHLPVQSGSSRLLEKMRRKYDRQWYLEKIAKIREVMPDCGLSTDVIAGFCSETPEDHQATLSLMEEVCFDSAFMFAYSERPGTLAARHYPDDIPLSVKTERLNEIIELQGRCSLKSNKTDIGKSFTVLVEGESKRSSTQMCGRNSQGKMCVFPRCRKDGSEPQPGDFVDVRVLDATAATLLCEII